MAARDENRSAGGTVKKWAISLIFLQNYKRSKQRNHLLGYSLEVTASYGQDYFERSFKHRVSPELQNLGGK